MHTVAMLTAANAITRCRRCLRVNLEFSPMASPVSLCGPSEGALS